MHNQRKVDEVLVHSALWSARKRGLTPLLLLVDLAATSMATSLLQGAFLKIHSEHLFPLHPYLSPVDGSNPTLLSLLLSTPLNNIKPKPDRSSSPPLDIVITMNLLLLPISTLPPPQLKPPKKSPKEHEHHILSLAHPRARTTAVAKAWVECEGRVMSQRGLVGW